MKPRVLLVTRIPFWRLGAGERMRLLALVWVLGQQTELTLLYLAPLLVNDAPWFQKLRIQCQVHFVQGSGPLSVTRDAEFKALRILSQQQAFDVCIFERIELDFLRTALPASVRTAIDTHDLQSVKGESCRQQGVVASDALSFGEELKRLAKFDKVLLIQADDYAQVEPQLGERAMLVPHPVTFAALPPQPERRNIGMVASSWVANLHGLDWFANQVWPFMDASTIQVHLFGWICDAWRPQFGGFVRHGFVADFKQAWGQIDVAINPVRWGSGLKIKNVEALGHGLPLVTTLEGARGLMLGADNAFRLGDTPEAFAKACTELLDQPVLRQQYAVAAHAFASQHFSPQACFGELMQWLKS
jgi:hypothetical protein